jgi:hypothetical protein
MRNKIMRIMLLVIAAAMLVCALWWKGDVSASMSLWKIFEFKIDAKEKREPPTEGAR